MGNGEFCGCNTDSDCAQDAFCDGDYCYGHQDVGCVDDLDCVEGSYCEFGLCTPEIVNDGGVPPIGHDGGVVAMDVVVGGRDRNLPPPRDTGDGNAITPNPNPVV